MEKVSKQLPMMVFLLCVIKSLILGPKAEDAAIVLFLTALVGWIYRQDKLFQKNDLEIRMNELKLEVEGLQKRQEELKTHVSGIKLGQNIRSKPF